jgi:hypothetical protein
MSNTATQTTTETPSKASKLDFKFFFGDGSWEERVSKLEAEGCDRSDAQAIVDAEDQ